MLRNITWLLHVLFSIWIRFGTDVQQEVLYNHVLHENQPTLSPFRNTGYDWTWIEGNYFLFPSFFCYNIRLIYLKSVDNKLFHQTDNFVCKSGRGGTAKPISYSLHSHEYSLWTCKSLFKHLWPSYWASLLQKISK
jgi:hypothetical protein